MSERVKGASWLAVVAALLAATCSAGCRFPWDDGLSVAASHRRETQFAASLVLSDSTAGDLKAGGTCDVPIRGQLRPNAVLPPEQGLAIVLSRAGEVTADALTDALGIASLATSVRGLHTVSLTTRDASVQAQITVDLQAQRTVIRGHIGPDAQDLDDDGDLAEGVLVAELLADADADRVSDDGTKSLWGCAADGGVAYWHRGHGQSERSRLGPGLQILDSTTFADRDGDWVPDAYDADADGDGIADAEELESLRCPGFTHASLATPGSLHESLPCNLCHLEDDPAPLACHDCHSEAGRAWLSSPEVLPDGHFLTDCDQCHPADQPWTVTTSPGTPLHETYPLDGAHRVTGCFQCHPTGNIAVPRTCSGCHAAETPPGHYDGDCDACHDTASWSSTVRRRR